MRFGSFSIEICRELVYNIIERLEKFFKYYPGSVVYVMFDSVNFAYVIELEINGEKCYMFSRRMPVKCIEVASKYSSRDSAYTAYKNSEFHKNGIKASFVIYDRNKNVVVNDKSLAQIAE